MRHVQPKADNIEDAALLEWAASTLRRTALDLQERAKEAKTSYAEDAFEEVLSQLDEAVSTLSSAGTSATENAVSDEADDLADYLYEMRRDD